MIIIYIHGFGGSGLGVKASAFREYFKSKAIPFIAPSLSYIPDLAIKTLEELIESYDNDVCLIGSSLGGYYSMYLSSKYDIKATLINPSIEPYKTLKKGLGDSPSFYDESSFKWTNTHIESLKSYEVDKLDKDNILLMIQKGDELLDYNVAVSKLDGSKMIVEEGGDHSFTGIERHFESVKKFFA